MMTEETSVMVAAIAPKIPDFYPADPDLWFTRAEAEFDTATPRITNDNTKFSYLVKALDQETAKRVRDLLTNPPEQGRYDELKKRLRETYQMSKRERASRILDYPDMDIGSAKKMADDMVGWMEGDGQLLLRECFLRRLPENVRAILEEDPATDIRELAKRADVISQREAQLFRVATPAKQAPANKGERKVRSDHCFYHRLFGSKALKCSPQFLS